MVITFKDYPEFQPDYTPYEVMKLGSFADQGGYWRPIHSRVLGKKVKDDYKQFDWGDLPLDKLILDKPDYTKNYYGVKSGTSLEYWESKNWIRPESPRGWFEWYTKFYGGVRTPDDPRQIKRWLGIKNRFGKLSNKTPKIKQTLLQWAIKSD